MIVVTAGHVDHGKTSLIKHLTGVDTDRLEEEKRRGLSIDLGFAYRKLENNKSIGFIDVPGHNRFINTMIAGINSIDLGLIIVAADDGPMPQTFEHLDIMRILGVKRFAVILTKIDRVDAARVKSLHETMSTMLSGGGSDHTPVFEVSNITEEGISHLLDFLDEMASHQENRSVEGLFRLSVDRAFVLKGAGLVVTGTAVSGQVSVGQTLKLLPQDIKIRVRSIYAQDQREESGYAGQRCALNITGEIDRKLIHRGDCLVESDGRVTTTRIDASARLLATAPFALKHMAPIKLYIGARRVAAKLFLVERGSGDSVRALQPGGETLVQLITDEPVSCCCQDRFLLRDDSESTTLGGGIVLDPAAPRFRKFSAARLDYLFAMQKPTACEALGDLFIEKQQMVDFTAFKEAWNLRDEEGVALLQSDKLRNRLHIEEEGRNCLLTSVELWQRNQKLVIAELQAWHRTNPDQQGVSLNVFTQQFKDRVDRRLVDALIADLTRNGALFLKGGLLQLAGHKTTVSDKAKDQWAVLVRILRFRSMQIPLLADLIADSGLSAETVNQLIRNAINGGQLHQVSDKRFALPETLHEIGLSVEAIARSQTAFSVVECKNQLDLGRNITIELLEYFDRIRFTQRRGNERVLLNAKVLERFTQE